VGQNFVEKKKLMDAWQRFETVVNTVLVSTLIVTLMSVVITLLEASMSEDYAKPVVRWVDTEVAVCRISSCKLMFWALKAAHKYELLTQMWITSNTLKRLCCCFFLF